MPLLLTLNVGKQAAGTGNGPDPAGTRIPPPGAYLRTGPCAAAFRFRQGRAVVIREGESIRQLCYASPYELSFLALLDERLCSVFFSLAEAPYICIRAACCSHLYSGTAGREAGCDARSIEGRSNGTCLCARGMTAERSRVGRG